MNQIQMFLKEESINKLKLPAKTILFLKKNKVCTLDELFNKTEDDFMRMSIPNSKRVLGRKELHVLLSAVDEYKESLKKVLSM